VECFKLEQGGGIRDIVDEKEGVRIQIGGGPKRPVFLLACGVDDGEGVCLAVYFAGAGVGIFYCWIVSSRP